MQKSLKGQTLNVVDLIIHLASKYGFSKSSGSKIYVDGANPSIIRALKDGLLDNPNYEDVAKECKSKNINLENAMLVIPVNFSQGRKRMLVHAKQLLEEDNISINPRLDNLITSLRTAVENEGSLDKDATSFDNVFDAFRMALKYYKLNG